MSESMKYMRMFNSDCNGWSDDPEKNVHTINKAQKIFNDILAKRGYVFLRDVYEYFGIPITKESIIMGWGYSIANKEKINFNPPDMNYYDNINVKLSDPNIPLYFNVDGVIIDKFQKEESF